MTSRDYLDDQDAEEPDDYVISLTSLVSAILSNLPERNQIAPSLDL